jgi:hypothetical protein
MDSGERERVSRGASEPVAYRSCWACSDTGHKVHPGVIKVQKEHFFITWKLNHTVVACLVMLSLLRHRSQSASRRNQSSKRTFFYYLKTKPYSSSLPGHAEPAQTQVTKHIQYWALQAQTKFIKNIFLLLENQTSSLPVRLSLLRHRLQWAHAPFTAEPTF